MLWNYEWYVDKSDAGNPENGNSYSADNLFTSNVGVYVRKKSDDLDLGTQLYVYDPLASKGAGPFFSQAPLIELRYTEVLMNLAEAACMAGHMDEAVAVLQQIRARAGYTAENNYGLQDNLVSDQATCMSAILYERQIEFAYEGKRFDDMRRWMLFDGGAQQPSGAPASWTLTGWGGNTCTWLGFTPMNGQRRERIEFRTGNQFGVGTAFWNGDPLVAAGVERPAGADFREADINAQLTALKTWYNANLVTQYKTGDGYDSQHNLEYINFRPKYYFLGLSSGAQNVNKGLVVFQNFVASNGQKDLKTDETMTTLERQFAQTVAEHKSTIYTVCYMFSQDADEVNDLFQEVLVNLWKGFESFEHRSDIRTWIYRVALNTCISIDRKKKVRTIRRSSEVRLTMDINLFEDRDEDTKQVDMLHKRISKLQPFDRAIVLLWLENLSYEEIGQIVGITAKNVSVRLFRIREQLKQMSND